jgi:N,N'-diacetylbacillosaminyl-diphospho-undecaprenol alpha-1,3-N-acetylgalactosaminyltransferase
MRRASENGQGPRIAFVCPDDFSLWHFHRDLIASVAERHGHPFAFTPPGPFAHRFQEIGATHVPLTLYRFISPARDLRVIAEMATAFRRHRIDIVHNFTIKPNVYGALAGRLAGARRVVATAEGLGVVFGDEAGGLGSVARLARAMYGWGCRMSDRVWFVNSDDRDLFLRLGFVKQRQVFQTISAGVNSANFRPATPDERRRARAALGLPEDKPVVTMAVARLIWSKGVQEYMTAASEVLASGTDAVFLLAGAVEEDSPDAVPREAVASARDVRWIGFAEDVKALYAATDVLVLPSYYREGVPNVLLEAMSSGIPVITTDQVGCREVVEHGANGLLVPPRDAAALARAIATTLASGEQALRMGREGRRRAVEEFEKSAVYDRVLTELYGLPDSSGR